MKGKFPVGTVELEGKVTYFKTINLKQGHGQGHKMDMNMI